MRLRVSGISCRYNSIRALDGIELAVNSGEFLGIIGPNGSGKTTLLKAISNILKPIIGSVLIDDQEVQSMSRMEVARKVAVVPQESQTSFNFTALEIVLMGRNPHMKPFAMETSTDIMIARQSMELTNCLFLENRRINDLSGGEKRRVLIARALVQDPSLLLLDEPTMNLDVANQIELMEMITGLCKDRKITVLSTFHDFNLAARYSNNMVLLERGKIVSLGSPEEVLTRENLQKVFRVRSEVLAHPVTKLTVTVLSSLGTNDHDEKVDPMISSKRTTSQGLRRKI